VVELRRLGKRIVFGFEGELFLVVHLMVAGRFRWREPGAKLAVGRIGLAALTFANGTLLLTEAGSKKRAALHVVRGEDALRAHDPGGLEVLSATFEQFLAALTRENHTLKRALTDPHLFSGIGNAYSDEILHRARLSPFVLTSRIARGDASGSSPPSSTACAHGRTSCAARPARAFPRRSPPSVRDGGARALQPALPGVRHAGAADRLRREREQLLSHLPDRRQAARRPRPLAAPQGRLAEDSRGARSEEARMNEARHQADLRLRTATVEDLRSF
jgi:hypothetical protein